MSWWWYPCKLMAGHRHHWSCGFCLLYHRGLHCIDPPSHLFCVSLPPLIRWWIMRSGLNSTQPFSGTRYFRFYCSTRVLSGITNSKFPAHHQPWNGFAFSRVSPCPSVCNKSSFDECVLMEFCLYGFQQWNSSYIYIGHYGWQGPDFDFVAPYVKFKRF
jgi:hypothetical protein